MSQSLYDAIGVLPSATQEEIEAACIRLGEELNPANKHGNLQAAIRFKEIEKAYEILSNPESRKRYDNDAKSTHLSEADTTESPNIRKTQGSSSKKLKVGVVITLVMACVFFAWVTSNKGGIAEESLVSKADNSQLVPFDFKGLKFGDSPDKFKEVFSDGVQFKVSCNDEIINKNFVSCHHGRSHETFLFLPTDNIGFGGISAHFWGIFLKTGPHQGLYQLSVRMNSQKFSEATQILIKKFGKPTSTEVSYVQNGVGNRVEDMTLYWERNGTSVRAKRFAKQLTLSEIIYQASTKEGIEAAEQAEVREKAGKI